MINRIRTSRALRRRAVTAPASGRSGSSSWHSISKDREPDRFAHREAGGSRDVLKPPMAVMVEHE
jgi:hypothetical protein